MKTSYGKLVTIAFALILCAMLLLPMHIGQEDSLILKPRRLKMAAGDSYHVVCALSSETDGQGLRFESSNEHVASIDPDGTIRAHASGEVEISAIATGGATARMKVIVSGVPVEQLSLNVDELKLNKGEYSGLSVSFNETASDHRLQWFSSDESVATVSDAGRVHAVSGGDAYISVLSVNGLGASCRVHVNVPATAVRLSPDELTLAVGTSFPLTTGFMPEDATDEARSFVTSDAAVATVDENGVLTATGPGSAHINLLTQGGLRDVMTVTVDPAPKELRIEPARATIERGDTLPLGLMFLDSDGTVHRGTTHPVNWVSSNDTVAAVDESGVVTALKSGRCRITAETDGRRAVCDVTVRVSTQSVTLNAEELTLLREDTGKKLRLKAKVTPADADAPVVSFESNNEQVAQVTPEGVVTMTGAYGTAVIRAYTADGSEAFFTLNVVTKLPEATATAAPATAAPAPAYEVRTEDTYETAPDANEPYDYEGEGYYDESTAGMLGDFEIDYGTSASEGEDFDMYDDAGDTDMYGDAEDFDMYGNAG